MLLHITEKCNYSCPHCFVDCTPDGNDTTWTVIHNAINMVERLGVKTLVIAGGEPTLKKDFIIDMYDILSRLSEKCTVVLATNGSFLHQPPHVNTEFAWLHEKFVFFTQITAVKHLYPLVDKTKAAYREFIKYHPELRDKVVIIDKMTVIDQLGRAKDKKFKKLCELYKRKAPMCFNLYSAAKHSSINDLKTLIHFVEVNTSVNCKPFIDVRGDIHPGEWVGCNTLGNILVDSDEKIFSKLRDGLPCGACGIESPFDLKVSTPDYINL